MADEEKRSSAESALLFDEAVVDPGRSTDDGRTLSRVWARCDYLRSLLQKRAEPTDDDRNALKAFLVAQQDTIWLYWQMSVWLERREEGKAPKTASLYVVLFPGETKDGTGIKDLNDKVLGYTWNSEFIRRRQDAIQGLFDTPTEGMAVAAQSYKTAYILTYDRTRKEFEKRFAELDRQLRVILMQILETAARDPDLDDEKRAACKKLHRFLEKRKKYKFDVFFGLRTLALGDDKLENVYLLVTEALKGAAIGRFIAMAKTLRKRRAFPAHKFAAGIEPDAKFDGRGKEYVWKTFFRASGGAEKIKALIVPGYTQASQYDYMQVYIDTVWTVVYLKRKNLYWGNPDVIRDVRKKKLKAPELKKGNVVYAFKPQKELLELWLLILNMLDYVKRFSSPEFRKEVAKYHDDLLEAYVDVGNPTRTIDWDRLERVLTHDVRQHTPIAVYEGASEFLFYSFAADYEERIFFNMDARDMGVELMMSYENANRLVVFNKDEGVDLMLETFRGTDVIDERRRETYDAVVATFKKYYGRLAKSSAAAKAEARKAFGERIEDADLPAFEKSVQIMLGGDEVFAAAHPLFAPYVHQIIRDLDAVARSRPYDDLRLELRAGVAFSKAERDPQDQRTRNQLSHQEAMKLADAATGPLKQLERTHRRIERLIDMLERNDKKKDKAPPYRKELEKLALMKVFGRAKYGDATPLSHKEFRALVAALEAEKIKDAEATNNYELVDFDGKVVDGVKLAGDAEKLEQRVRADVGFDNARVQLPPVDDASKAWKRIQKIWDCYVDPDCWPF